MNLGIRTPLPQDIPALLALVSQPGVQAGTGRLPYLPESWVRDRIEGRDANTHSIVGTLDNVPVAWGNLVRKTDRRSHSAEIDLSVRDDHAEKGIGRAMLKALLSYADQWLGLQRIELEVLTANAAAIALYQQMGFQIEGTRRAALLTDGVLCDTHIMARLSPAPLPESKT